MQRKDYTSSKTSKLFSTTVAYVQQGRENFKHSGQMTIVREYDALQLQAKQLEIVNKQLLSEAEKMRYEKSLHQNKLLQKASFQEQAMAQFQKEKAYQIEMLLSKNEEDIKRICREYQKKIEDMQTQIKSRQLYGQDLTDKHVVLEARVHESRSCLEKMETDLVKQREANSSLTEQITREQFANKKMQMMVQQLQRQRNEMEGEIHILLDIQSEKNRTLTSIQLQYRQSEESIANLNEKLGLLTNNFASLEEHISVMKDRLLNAETRGEELEKQLQATQLEINEREQLYSEQKERELRIRNEIQVHKQREIQRLGEIRQLICQNQRIYSDLNAIRFKLYDVSIQQGIDV